MKQTKIGIFGGAFNPPHEGHLKSLQHSFKTLNLDALYALPYYQSPHTKNLENSFPADRLNMLSMLLDKEKNIKADAFEIKQKQISYTYLTIDEFIKNKPNSDLFLIMGVDSFETFNSWKNFEQILSQSNIVVTTRAGISFKDLKNYIPSEIKALAMEDITKQFDIKNKKIIKILLSTGKFLYLINGPCVFASSTDLRQFIKDNKTCPKYLSKNIFSYIQEHNLYLDKYRKVDDSKAFSLFCSKFLTKQGGLGSLAFNLTEKNTMSDFSVISSADNTKKVSFLASELIKAVLIEYGVKPQNTEGLDDGRWVILDYGFTLVHLFYEPLRGKYYLEELWKDCEEL